MVDVGYLFALDSLNAVGGTLVAGMNDVDGWIGAQGRYRRWLGSRMSMDVGLGLAATGGNIKAPLVTVAAGLNFTETWSLYAQLQPIDAREWGTQEFTGTKLAPSVTARVGSRLGLVLAGAVAAFVAGFAAWASL